MGPASKMATDNNSCTVKALSAAFSISYDDAHSFAAKEWNRVTGRGVRTSAMLQTFPIGFSTQSRALGKEITRAKATSEYKQPNGTMLERAMNLSTFCKKHPRGTYYILVDGHALVISDGEVIDHSDRPKRRIKFAWKIS